MSSRGMGCISIREKRHVMLNTVLVKGVRPVQSSENEDYSANAYHWSNIVYHTLQPIGTSCHYTDVVERMRPVLREQRLHNCLKPLEEKNWRLHTVLSQIDIQIVPFIQQFACTHELVSFLVALQIAHSITNTSLSKIFSFCQPLTQWQEENSSHPIRDFPRPDRNGLIISLTSSLLQEFLPKHQKIVLWY